MKKPDEEFLRTVTEMVEKNDVSPNDLRVVAEALENARQVDDKIEVNLESLSASQKMVLDTVLNSFLSSDHEKAVSSAPADQLKQFDFPGEMGNESNSLGLNASRLLLFVLDEPAVEARVGDLVEQLPRIKARYGDTYGIVHFWWSVFCFFAAAIWGNTPVKKLIDASIEKWRGN